MAYFIANLLISCGELYTQATQAADSDDASPEASALRFSGGTGTGCTNWDEIRHNAAFSEYLDAHAATWKLFVADPEVREYVPKDESALRDLKQRLEEALTAVNDRLASSSEAPEAS